jgi:cytidylate kinase
MENILKNYFEKIYLEQEAAKPATLRPVITISREYGCPSKSIAQMLSDTLNKKTENTGEPKWKFISKEIVEEAARKLDIKTVQMNYLISSGEKGIFEDFLTSFSPTYASSLKVKKILTDVIRSLADQGNIVIVGRGSVAILQHRPNTFHIRLNAPQEIRIRAICDSKNLKEAAAKKLLAETDKKRLELIELLLGHKFDPCIFDLAFNCSTFSKEEIMQSILRIMEIRKMI